MTLAQRKKGLRAFCTAFALSFTIGALLDVVKERPIDLVGNLIVAIAVAAALGLAYGTAGILKND